MRNPLSQAEERQVGRGIVEKGRESSGCPEKMPGEADPEFRPPRLQNEKRRDHRDEYAGKEDGYLDDRGVVKLVASVNPSGG